MSSTGGFRSGVHEPRPGRVAVIRRTASKVLLANFASMFSEICATPVQGAYPSDGPIMDVLLSDHALPARAAQAPRLRPVEGVFDADSAGREDAAGRAYE